MATMQPLTDEQAATIWTEQGERFDSSRALDHMLPQIRRAESEALDAFMLARTTETTPT